MTRDRKYPKIDFRVSRAEKEALWKKAKEQGITPSKLIRETLFAGWTVVTKK